MVLEGVVLVGVVLLVLLGTAHVSATAWKSAAHSSAQKLRSSTRSDATGLLRVRGRVRGRVRVCYS